MAITYGEAKQKVAQWAGRGGKCVTNPDVDSFLREVLDYMLISGTYGNLRKYTFTAIKGVFTIPYELENVLKVKINGETGTSFDKWFEFQSNVGDLDNCLPTNAFYEENNYCPTVYDLPPGGAHIGIIPICKESEDSFLIVKGFDITGREVITLRGEESVVGEWLTPEYGKLKYSNVKFARITEVYKSKTDGYIQLLWYRPENGEKGFLSDYSPFEEKPQYRRYRINVKCAPIAQVSVLGRIRLKPHYADNDLIPFDNLYTLSAAAQAIYATYNSDVPTAAAKDQLVQTLIKRENDIKKVQNGNTVEVYVPLSGGSIKNIVF